MIIDKSKIKTLDIKKPLQLESGQVLDGFTIAYETFGTLNQNKDNAILVFHALSGDQFATGTNPITGKDGWWVTAIGPNKAVDTNKYFIICANVLGGCMGTSGPTSINPKTKEFYCNSFPLVTIKDMVNAQIPLLDHFQIEKTLCVLGGPRNHRLACASQRSDRQSATSQQRSCRSSHQEGCAPRRDPSHIPYGSPHWSRRGWRT